ncbi:MAG: transposase [Fibrobacterota bacterium]
MSTKPRMNLPFAHYQIRSEAHPEVNLFPSREQEVFFLAVLQNLLDRSGFSCLDMSLQKDHYHLVVEASEITVSWFMRTLNSIYAKYINKHHNRKGQVFPKRFASAVLDEKAGLEEVCCHVHLNQVKFRKLHGGGKRNIGRHRVHYRPELTKYYLEYRKQNRKSTSYRKTIRMLRTSNYLGYEAQDPKTHVIGTAAFTQKCLMMYDTVNMKSRAKKLRDPQGFLEQLHNELSLLFPFRTKELFERGYRNKRSRARESMALLGVYELGFSGADLARYLGVTRSAISRMISRIAKTPPRRPDVKTLRDSIGRSISE